MSFASPGAGPDQGNALLQAALWLQDVMTGPLATGAATLAVAALGFGLLTGRVDVRRAGTIVLGCFLIFGARSVVDAIMPSQPSATPPVALAEPLAAPVPTSTPFDPYAGASPRW